MKTSEWRPFGGTLMTSERIEAYGGFSVSVQLLRDLVPQINASGIPFHLDHDLSKPIRVRGFAAFVESRPDGIDELRFRAEIHEDDFHLSGSRTGLSVTLTTPIPGERIGVNDEDVPLRLSADHAWFADEALIEAETRLIEHGVDSELIQVERAYQFSFVPDPQIFVDVVYPLLISIGAGAIWDGIKKLFGQRKTPSGGDEMSPTVVNVLITDGDRSLKAVVTTIDEAVARRAIESLDHAMTAFFQSSPSSTPEDKNKSVTVWDDASGDWTPPA